MNFVGKKDLTKDVKQVDIVVLSVFLLGGDTKSIDTEDVAMKCHRLNPKMFSWRKYPEQINLELVRVALSDAKKPQNGALLQGSGKEGWRLKSRGLSWIQTSGKTMLEGPINWQEERRQAGSVDTRRIDRERQRIKSSKAWKSWIETGSVLLMDAQELFRIDGYSSDNMAETKIVRMQSIFSEDAPIAQFLSSTGQLIIDARTKKHD